MGKKKVVEPEIFDICSSGPGPSGASSEMPGLKKNTPFVNKLVVGKRGIKEFEKGNKELMDDNSLIIHEWAVPDNIHIVFDPTDKCCEMLCQTIGGSSSWLDEERAKNYISGEVLIYVKRKNNNKRELVYIGSSLFSSPYSDVSIYSYTREYQRKVTANPGDVIITSLVAGKEICPESSFIDHRVTLYRDK